MSFIFPLWAQRQPGFGDLIQLLFLLLIIVVPAVFKFFAEQMASKERRRLEEATLEKHLHDAFMTATAVESLEEPVRPIVRPRPKKERKRKRTELVLAELDLKDDDKPPICTTPLSRGLAPQGEGSRFEATPGTFDGSQVLTPGVEPTVQPMLDSMTGIYDAPPGGEPSVQTPLAVDIYQMLTNPSGIRQAVVLGEILKRPEF